MCELTNGKRYIADRDITCYKLVMDDYWRSYGKQISYLPAVQSSSNSGSLIRYKEGEEYIETRFCLSWERVKEYWAFDAKKKTWKNGVCSDISLFAVRDNFAPCRNKIWFVNENPIDGMFLTHYGFYSYTYFMNGKMKDNAKWLTKFPGTYRVARCKIPAGAEYYVSDNGEAFISNKIVFEKALPITFEKENKLCA